MLACVAGAQTPSPTPSPAPAEATPHSNRAEPRLAGLKRWLDLDALAISTRYRYIENNAGVVTNNQNQWQFNARGRFKFDRKAKYSVYAVVGTGYNITSGWNNTGWGTGDTQWNLFVKQLYFEAKPVKQVGIQFGGLGFNNGENTEITAYDNDAFLTGERVQFRAPKQLYFDEISVTFGHVGDAARPNVFRRFKRLDEWNYHQTLVRKKVNNVVSFSADYSYGAGSDRLRQAVRFRIPKGNFLDTVLLENYQQLDPDLGYGFNIFADKQLWKRLTLGGGFARVDTVMFNADRFPIGNRLYTNTTLRLTREFSLQTAFIHAVGPLRSSSIPRTRLDIILTYNILESLKKNKIW